MVKSPVSNPFAIAFGGLRRCAQQPSFPYGDAYRTKSTNPTLTSSIVQPGRLIVFRGVARASSDRFRLMRQAKQRARKGSLRK